MVKKPNHLRIRKHLPFKVVRHPLGITELAVADAVCVGAKESDTSSPSEISVNRQDQGSEACSTDAVVVKALRNAGLLPDEVDDSSAKIMEEKPDIVFEMDSHLEEDIYGDFEYDLEDEDYIGVTAEKALKMQRAMRSWGVVLYLMSLPKNNNDDGTDRSCASLEPLPDEADNRKHVLQHIENAFEPGIEIKEENKVIDPLGHGSSGRVSSAENVTKKDKKSNMEIEKQADGANPVSKRAMDFLNGLFSSYLHSAAHTSNALQTQVASQTLPMTMSHNEKLVKFNGENFKTWQQKMLFYLTTLNLAKFLKDDPPTIREDEVDAATTFNITKAWKHSDFLCHNYILNGLSDALYEVYNVKKKAKELWESLDHKYKTEDAGAKKFLVAKFLNFVMVNSKTVVNQVQEFQLIIHSILAEGMIISESFQVATIIEKLSPAWNDFKNYLKHKRKEMTVEYLIVRIWIEEDNQCVAKRLNKTSNHNIAKANVMEVKMDFKKRKQAQIESKLGLKGGVSKKQKIQGKCFNCNKTGHMSSEFNLVDSNPREWWLDTGATHHICCDKDSFAELVSCEKGEKLYMGNVATSTIKGKDTVILKMTSGKELKLQNVLYVPDIRKNLVFGTLLSIHSFRMVFESHKLVLSKGEYLWEGDMY
ncbi:UPF0481 protein [Hibiscus syriacus]|uniref:UPF0481 protein n=1 Tax=Hibiscus syriacus TaxID=106335 RepID=A0A6A3D322_HIBSY|nr:UPF0481 protein [Hibiscus syriacus]